MFFCHPDVPRWIRIFDIGIEESLDFAQGKHWDSYMIDFGDTGLRYFIWQLPLPSFYLHCWASILRGRKLFKK